MISAVRFLALLVKAPHNGIATFGNVGIIEGALANHHELIFDQSMLVLVGKFSIAPAKLFKP